MKAFVHTTTTQESNSILISRKIQILLLQPLRAGFFGFSAILILIFFINLLSFIVGIDEQFGLDILDLLLAGVGFFLQMARALTKSFVK